MPSGRRGVSIPEPKWQEILRLLKILPFLAQTPSAFVLKAIDHEIERVWEKFKVKPGSVLKPADDAELGRPEPVPNAGESRSASLGTGYRPLGRQKPHHQ
jgi:hypothetical protein